MKLQILLLSIIIATGGCCPLSRHVRQITTPSSDEIAESDETINEDPCEINEIAQERGRIAAEYFPETISRDRAKKILRRAQELLDKPPKRERLDCSRANVNQDAKNTLRFLTGDPNIGSTSEDSSQAPSISSGSQFCERDLINTSSERRVS